MKSKSILEVALRIGAIIIVLIILEKIPFNPTYYYIGDKLNWYMFTGMTLLPLLIILLVAISMWVSPDRFLNHISSKKELNSKDLDMDKLGTSLIAIVGLYIVTFSISDLVYHLTSIKMATSVLGSDFKMVPEQIASLAATIVELIIGVLLIYGRNIISAIVLQYKGEIKGGL